MGHRHHNPKQIITKLRLADAALAQGASVADVCRQLRISQATYYRWRRRFDHTYCIPVNKDWNELARTWDCSLLHQISRGAARNLRYEVAGAVGAVFGKPSDPRSMAIRDELRGFQNALVGLFDCHDALSHQARSLLEEQSVSSRSATPFYELLDRLRPLAKELAGLANAIDEIASESGESKGGRNRDARIDRLVMSLATLYARQTGKRPYHTTDIERGEPVSEFNTFVEDVLAHFLPEIPVPPTSLREAMRYTAAGIAWNED